MAFQITWDKIGERLYETGVDRVVLYPIGTNGDYPKGSPWNGVTSITDRPTGAESNPQYADNIKYLNLVSAEDQEGTIEAFTFPDEWKECDGMASPTPGVTLSQQKRRTFGLSYRTKIGNDTEGQDYGYKIHLVWGATTTPSEKTYSTINDSPEATTLSWEYTTTPVEVPGYKPTAALTIDSTTVAADKLAALEEILYGKAGATEGDTGTDARLPLPEEIITLLTPSTAG